MLSGEGRIYIAPHTEEVVEIDAGEEMTGYLHLLLEKGAGSGIQLVQAESYIQPGETAPGMAPLKTDRQDAQNGVLLGYQDFYQLTGNGEREKPEEYEPFWFRTFRFIKLFIKTGEEPLWIQDFYFRGDGISAGGKIQSGNVG